MLAGIENQAARKSIDSVPLHTVLEKLQKGG
jgi:hypothetical protein